MRVGGCWYRLRDETAGVRAYTSRGRTRRFWVGFYNAKAIDHYTGAPLAVHLTSASVQEHASYPELYDKTVAALGRHPDAVVGDRGYSIASVFERNTRLGVASVFPWRKRRAGMKRDEEDTPLYDRHGIVRCKHCGSPTRLVRFSAKGRPGPRLWVRCSVPATDACHREQTQLCKQDWRLLLPLWRTDPLYHALRKSHRRYERVHQHWRARYLVGGDHHAVRPKRRGIAWQQLRANAALLVEWLVILWREGWLGNARRHKGKVCIDKGDDQLKELERARVAAGLAGAYGPNAKKKGTGGERPTPGADGDPKRRREKPPPPG